MSRQKILVIPPNDLLRHPIPNRMYHIVKHLSKYYDIILLSYPGHPLRNGILRYLNAKEIEYRAIRAKDLGTYYIINTPIMLPIIEQVLEEVDVIIHANILPSFIATKLVKRHSKVAIYDYVDHYPQSASAYYKGSVRNIIEKGVFLIVLETLKNSTAIVTPSYGLASFIRRYTDKSIHIIPNGVDSEVFKPIDMNSARKYIGIDYDGPILLLYGSIDVWLEIKPILYAIKRNKDARLLVVGYSHGKYYYKLLESLIKKLDIENRIYKYPPQPYEKMPLFVNASNIIVAPFTHGIISFATPLKIIESLACARPVMTIEISEFKLWFRKGIYYYRSPHDAYRLLDKLIKEFSDIHTQLLSYSKIVRDKYSWKNITETYKKVIENPHNVVSSYWYTT